MRNIGTHFVGKRSSKIVILGIAKFAENVVIGENGIVTIAISALMVLVYHVNIVVSQAHIQILNKIGRTRRLKGPGGLRRFQTYMIYGKLLVSQNALVYAPGPSAPPFDSPKGV
jgi:hypothetical protein